MKFIHSTLVSLLLLFLCACLQGLQALSVKKTSFELTTRVVLNMTATAKSIHPSGTLLQGIKAVDHIFRRRSHERLSLALAEYRRIEKTLALSNSRKNSTTSDIKDTGDSLANTTRKSSDITSESLYFSVYKTLKVLELDFMNISVAGFFSRAPPMDKKYPHFKLFYIF